MKYIVIFILQTIFSFVMCERSEKMAKIPQTYPILRRKKYILFELILSFIDKKNRNN